MSAIEVHKETGIVKKEVDKVFKEMKADGTITSPVECEWEPPKQTIKQTLFSIERSLSPFN